MSTEVRQRLSSLDNRELELSSEKEEIVKQKAELANGNIIKSGARETSV